jgi:hypothetical protein
MPIQRLSLIGLKHITARVMRGTPAPLRFNNQEYIKFSTSYRLSLFLLSFRGTNKPNIDIPFIINIHSVAT